MSNYTFVFKKDDIIVNFSTTDRDVVERQFQIWVAAADSYAKSHKGRRAEGGNTPKTAEQPKEPEPEPAREHIEENVVEQVIKPEIKQPEPVVEKTQPETFDKASTLLRTINSIQGATKEDVVTTEQQEETHTENTAETAQDASDFEAVLEKSIENPTFEPSKTKDQVFLNLINSKNTTDKFHYLMITAYYLSEFEKLERFSLKQINAKLMQNLAEVIDHTTLQEAINQNFVEVVPDLTGTSEIGEYRLTTLGEEFFANKI